jgi:hypothetical protein
MRWSDDSRSSPSSGQPRPLTGALTWAPLEKGNSYEAIVNV